MSVLAEICAKKAVHVAAMREIKPLSLLAETIARTPKPRGFINTLKNHAAPAIIAEIKKASPSRGIIRENFNPAEIAKIYESAGAACLSVLTDEPYFQGHDAYLQQVRAVTKLPLLRKDFMVDPYQIHESRSLGADCVLLIMAALSDHQACEFYEIAITLGMDVLIEVHDEPELRRALNMDFAPDSAMIGINNRNLKTLSVDINTSHHLGKLIPAGLIKVAESGISDPRTIQRLRTEGFNAFLVGESLMREKDIAAALKNLGTGTD
jgi:indole-3-glycerol phosphate synthase